MDSKRWKQSACAMAVGAYTDWLNERSGPRRPKWRREEVVVGAETTEPLFTALVDALKLGAVFGIVNQSLKRTSHQLLK